jgi:hypothetical protein
MSKRRCHYATISFCDNLTSATAKSEQAFEVILWVNEPELTIEVTEVDPFPEMDEMSREMANHIGPMAIEFVELCLQKEMPTQLIMPALERRIRGSFYISKIGEEVRKTRDTAA